MTDEQQMADATRTMEPEPVSSPGTQLRAARERAGWTIERLAAELCLPPERLRALEADDHASFGGVVYVRGYLRRAAALLELSAEELIAAYETCCNSPSPTDILPGPLPGKLPRPGLPGWAAPLSGVTAAVAVLAFTWWMMAPDGSERALNDEDAAADTSPALEFLAAEELPAAPEEQAAASSEPLPGDESDSGEDETAAAVSRLAERAPPLPEPGGDATGAPAAQAEDDGRASARVVAVPEAEILPPGTVELRFEFTEDCWLEVEDAREKRLAYRLYRAGDMARLRGTAPVSVFLGNAEGTRLSVDGSPIAVRPAARRDGTARLTVGGGEG